MVGWSRRVLVVDDDPMVTSLVSALLSNAGFTVESCGDAVTARELVKAFDPDLAILDVNLGGGPTGLQLGYVISRLHPDIALLYLTRYPTALLTDPAMAEHVRQQTVLAKDEIRDPSVLLEAIEDAFRGSASTVTSSAAVDTTVRQLTAAQLDVLALVAEGRTNAAIAELRQTKERAVEKQLNRIYETLGIEVTRDHNARVLAAMKYAQALGWTGLPEPEPAPEDGLWGAKSAQPRAEKLSLAQREWTECATELREALVHLVEVGTAPQVDVEALAQALEPFVRPSHPIHRGVELIVTSTFTPPLAAAVEETAGRDVDDWLTPVRGRMTRTMAAENAMLVGVALGLVTDSWHANSLDVDLRPALAPFAEALSHPAQPRRLPAIRATHLDAPAVIDTGDAERDRVLLVALECVGEVGLEATTPDVLQAALGIPGDDIVARFGPVRELFTQASAQMLAPAVRLNSEFQADLAIAHPLAIAEACLLREFMRPERRRMRTITFEQLRLAIDDRSLQQSIGIALQQRGDEMARESPRKSPEAIRASLVLENAVSSGLALLAQLRPTVGALPFDAILVPWRSAS